MNRADIEDIKSIRDLFAMDNLYIPEYQRPYKWTKKNVRQLIGDIQQHKNKTAYRLGTIVFHKENSRLNRSGPQKLDNDLSFIYISFIYRNKEIY